MQFCLILLADGDFFHLLITFANSLNPDQDQQNVGFAFYSLIVFQKKLFETVNFEKKSADNNKTMKYYPVSKELINHTAIML